MLTQACKKCGNCTLINSSVGLPKHAQNDHLKTTKL